MVRSRVVVRSFYEDAYLGFFIRYYLDLGFDEIVILKADAHIFDGPNLPAYAINTGLITQTELDSGRIKIKAVKNTGNLILKDHYSEFTNPGADWVLNIDLDEFLVIDTVEYPGGINEYLARTKQRLYDEGRIDDPDHLQQIKFRWLCINKMDTRFNSSALSIINELPLSATSISVNNSDTNSVNNSDTDNVNNSDTDNVNNANTDSIDNRIDIASMENNNKTDGLAMVDYVGSNKLEMYSYVKSIGAVKHLNKTNKINCHFFILKKIEDKISIVEGQPARRPHYILFDNQFLRINTHKSARPAEAYKCMRQGFVLHLNTRSLANALTKCLVTELRDNKKIANVGVFKEWVNKFKLDYLLTLYQNRNNKMSIITEITTKFMSHLNSKNYFPKKIAAFHKHFANKLDLPATVAMLDRLISHLPLKTQHAMVGDVKTEWMQLQQLCKKRGINYSNLKAILELF